VISDGPIYSPDGHTDCRFGPEEGFGGSVVLANVSADGVLEVGDGLEDAASDTATSSRGEKPSRR
jgi:hypothetical protein